MVTGYIGKACRHFKTRIKEHIKKDSKSHNFKHLPSTATCFDWHIFFYFKIIDKANSKFDLKIKEALHVNCRKSKLNAQRNDLALTLSLLLMSPPLLILFFFYLVWFCFCFCFFAFLFHLLFKLSFTLIIDIFYGLNCTLLLLDLITTLLAVSHLSLSSIVFIISRLIISIFYCFDYTSLLLHLFTSHLVIYFMITV